MSRETRRRTITSALGIMIFTVLMWILSKDLETWQAIAIAGAASILYLILILWENPHAKPKTIVIKVKAWDNEDVRIRALTASEEVEVMRLRSQNKWTGAEALTAHYAMVELNELHKGIISPGRYKFAGIQEIAEASEGMAKSGDKRLRRACVGHICVGSFGRM